MSGAANNRLAWLDALRGLTIVLVVAGHVGRGMWASGRIDAPEYLQWDVALYSFHGPLLFVLCGFTFHFSTSRARFLDTWPRRLRKVLQPYVVWTVIAASLTFAMAHLVNRPMGTGEYILTVFGMVIWPYSIFWFLYVLAMCQMAAALLMERFGLGDRGLMICALVGLGFGAVLRALFGPIDAFQVSMFFLMFFFFCWGKWLSTRTDHLTMPVLWLTGGLSVVCWWAIIQLGWGIDNLFGAFTGLCATTFLLALFRLGENIAPRQALRGAVFLGLMSLEIYVMHHMAAGIFRIALGLAGVETMWIHVVGGLIAGVMGPVIVAWMIGQVGLTGALGLTPRKARTPKPKPESSASKGHSIL
ncbi:acyltransferase [Rhodobacteraceae bacterium KMM 6894]|nr:acyltransferase [Rhodobacteraceae bacterium KMM 6894]